MSAVLREPALDPLAEAAPDPASLVEVAGLTVSFGMAAAVSDADLSLRPGEIHAVVGESGSGKTLLARTLIGLLPDGAQVRARRLSFDGQDLRAMGAQALRRLRGAQIGMVFQEPLVSLNPAMRIGTQLAEGMRLHRGLDAEEARQHCIAMLERIRIADPEGCLAKYPHEFSGGMRQRIMLASVFLLKPRLLLADEPTTALDAVVRREILDLMAELAREAGSAVLLVSHDLALVANYADRVTVMHRGRVVESGRMREVILQPREVYTRELLEALPRRGPLPAVRSGDPVVRAEGVSVVFGEKRSWPARRQARHVAVHSAAFQIAAGETLGVVGESGSGKTTLARALLRLTSASGKMSIGGRDVSLLSGVGLRTLRQKAQIVFQDPYSSLDPRMRIVDIVAEGLRHQPTISPAQRRLRVASMLEEVGLTAAHAKRFPHELSGGERQRVAIARAMVLEPQLLVADEPASALDMTVQARVLRLLQRLQEQHGFACLFISHDLGVIEQVSHRVLVMYRGHVVETATRDQLFASPRHPYTRKLLAAVPELCPCDGGFEVRYRQAAQLPPPRGFAYFNDGSLPDMPITAGQPSLVEVELGHWVACCVGPA